MTAVLPLARRSDAQADGARAPQLAVIIPCFQVAQTVGAVIRSIPERFATIVCVDDASGDGTSEAIRAEGDPRVVLLRHEANRGVGGAMKTGYAEALRRGAEVLVKMDGDGQMSAGDLDALLGPVLDGSADYAKGNRFVDLVALRRMPPVRLLGNAGLSLASKLASGYWNVLDVTNGFTAIRREALERLELARLSDRYFFETSALIELNIARARVADVAMPARYAGERSSLRLGAVLLQFPPLLLRGLLRRLYWRYLIQDFGALSVCLLAGVPLLLFGLAFGLWHWLASIRSGVPATAGTVFVAALPVILGFQLLLAAVVLDVVSSPSQKRGPG